MAYLSGKNAAVKIGTSTVVGMGNWNISGITADRLETSAFGTQWKTFSLGMLDGGTITFSGLYSNSDTTGQDVLKLANLNDTQVTTLRLYIDNASYYVPCQTSGYFDPNNTTAAGDSVLSHVKIESWSVVADKGDMVKIDFTAKVSGCMVLV